ncbi:hypothetical protein BJ912DRAFT_189568 [Pholiota molesta]|nr:hypothetical protein BJ912DRAFT_189568 [Pholiota molesta]
MPSNYSTDEEDSDSDFSERDVCPKHALGESCTACDATAAIDRQIFEAQVSLAVLRQRRILSLGNMNNVHDPLVSQLPIEVIASIFTAFLPPNVDKRYSIICPEDVPLWETPTTPLVLGAVCKTWRSVVWSTPKLWTSISVDIYHSHDRLVDLVGEWLGRSGRLPLYMQLYAPPECEAHRCDRWASECSSPPRGSEPYIAKLMDVINAYSDRWFYIDLSLPRLYIEQVRFMDGQAQMLNTLKLEAIAVCTIKSPIRDREFGKDLKVAKIPNLRTVCARGFFFHQLDIDFQNLTCIEASKIPAETCLELLQAAPFLTHCIFWDVTCSHNMHDLIQHSSLTCLLVKGFWAEDILRLTNLPELEHLSTCLYRSGAEFEGFIERSGCLLKSVSLDLHLPKECDPEPLISFIRSTMPLSLETLTLDCTYSKSQYFTEWNTLINRVAMANNDPLLPNLKTLRIAVRDPPGIVFLLCLAIHMLSAQFSIFHWNPEDISTFSLLLISHRI